MSFNRKYAVGVGLTATQLQENGAVYQTAAGEADVLIGMLLCNKLGNQDIAVDIYVKNATTGIVVYLAKGLTVLQGATEEYCDGNKIILMPGDQLFAVSTVAASLDVWASFMESP